MEGEDGGDSGVKRGCDVGFMTGRMPAMSRILRNKKFILQKVLVSERDMMKIHHATKIVSSSATIMAERYDLYR